MVVLLLTIFYGLQEAEQQHHKETFTKTPIRLPLPLEEGPGEGYH